MPADPAVQTSEHTPIVAALLTLPGVTQIGRAFGITGISPSSEPIDCSASKVYPTSRGQRGDGGRTQARNERIRGMAAFLTQTSPSRSAYDGGGSGRENAPGAMAPATKATIAVIPIGESTGPVYTDFILTGVAEQDVEKTEVVETFGAFHLFTAGRFARKYQFTGMVRSHPVNHAAGAGGVRGSGYSALNVPAAVKLRNLYETYLRATVQAQRQTFSRITVDRDSYDGWITTLNLTRDANNEFFTTFSFTMVAYRRTHEKDGSAQALLKTFDAVNGKTQKPVPRMKAEVAASVGACKPVWYINGAAAGTSGTVTVSEDDSGLSCLQSLRILLKSESGADTAIGGTCKLTASLGGQAIELSAVGIAQSIFNLTTPQTIFTDNLVFRSVSDIGAGKNSVLLEVTATGSDEAGQATTAVLTIPIKVSGVSKTRISGYRVYRASDSQLLSTLTFPTDAEAQLKYGEALDDTVSITTARTNAPGGSITAFGYYVEPVCVDAKSGQPVTTPADLQLRLSLCDYPDNRAITKLGGLTAGKALLVYNYTTDLEAANGTDELQSKGASSIDLVIDAVPQESAEAVPRATLRTKFPTVAAPFPFVSPLRVQAGDGGRLQVLLTTKPGLTADAAVALATRLSIDAYDSNNDLSMTASSQVCLITGGPRSGTSRSGKDFRFTGWKASTVTSTFPGSTQQRQFVLLSAEPHGDGFVSTLKIPEGPGTINVRMPLGVPAPNVGNDSLFASAWASLPA